MKQKNYSKMGMVFSFLKTSKRFFVLSTLSALLVSVFELLSPQIVRFTVDSVIGTEPPDLPQFIIDMIDSIGGVGFFRESFWVIPVGIVAVAVFQVIFKYAFSVFNTRGTETLVKRMRDTLFSHIERLPYAWHMKNQTGDIIQRCTSDVETVKRFLSEQLTQVFRIVCLLTMSLIFMFSMNTTLSLIALCAIPLIFAYSLLFHKKISGSFAECDENEGKLSTIAQENLTGVRVVRAFGREKYERDKFEEQNNKYCSLWTRLSLIFSVFWGTADIISGIQVMLIIVVGAVLTINGTITAGEYITFISYNSMLIWPVRMLGRMIANISKAGVAMDRIYYIMSSEEEKDRENALTPSFEGADICFENVSFGYEGAPELLHGINVHIKAGTTVGILGGTGSGKSTLIHLLDKLYDVEEGKGRITIGGVDVRDIKCSHLRENVGIVLQEPYLFSRSIKENIGIASNVISMDEVREACRTASFEETADSFAEGFDTFVGERGVTLSGGQKQRAAIARMLIKKTPVMIFDDSMSALDTETDAKIRSALKEKLGSATVIIVSHRITTLMQADQILVLEEGKITERGTHAELIEKDGLYSKVYKLQSSIGEEAEK